MKAETPRGTGARRRARRGEGDRLRVEILDAAERLLIAHGSPDDVSLRAVAAEVGVSAPAIYLHFADKDEVFFEVSARRFEELATLVEGARPAPGASILEHLEAMGRTYIAFGLASGEHYEVMFLRPVPRGVPEDEAWQLPGPRILARVVELLAQGAEAGEVRADIDLKAAATVLWAVMHGTVLVVLTHRKNPALPLPVEEDLVDQAIALALASVAA